MAAVAFNSLEYAHKLEKAGMSKELAEVQAQAQFEIIHTLVEDHTVTKQDVKDLRQDIRDICRDIKDLKHCIETVKKEVTIKLGLMSSGLFILVALMKLFHP